MRAPVSRSPLPGPQFRSSSHTCRTYEAVRPGTDLGEIASSSCHLPLSEPRDEWARLSGSHLETHEDRSPADANCCQSLLLDPHVTITMTCTNGCSHWSPHEENRPRFFL